MDAKRIRDHLDISKNHEAGLIPVSTLIVLGQAAQALEAQEWRDIESAPKDGTRVLLFVPPYGPSTGHFEDSSLSVPHWIMHSVLNKEANPTHWKPLTPPETE